MNILKRKRALHALKKHPAVPKLEICTRMQPYLQQYGLTLTDDAICFPEQRPYFQKLIQLVSAHEIYRKSIPYSEIVQIGYNYRELRLILRTGHIFRFAQGCPLWHISNTYGYGEPMRITVRWWTFSGGAVKVWWKVKEWFGLRKTESAKE